MPLDPAIADIPFASENPAQEPPQTNVVHLPPEPVAAPPQPAAPTGPVIVPGTPTIAEIREYNRLNGIVNPVLDLSAEEIANLATNDPEHFNLEQSLIKLRPYWDRETIAKSADAYNLLERRGWKPPGDLGLSQLPGMAVGAIKGGASWIASLAKGAVGVPAALAMEKIDSLMGLPPSPAAILSRQKLQQGISETAAATEADVTGLAFQGAKAFDKLFGKRPELKTPEEKIQSLQAALIPHLAQQKIAEGGGIIQPSPAVQEELSQAGLAVRPAEVEKKIAGDPVGFLLFGKGLEGVGALAGLAKPAIAAAAKIPGVLPAAEAISKVLPTAESVVGKGVSAAGKTLDIAGKVVEKTAPIAAPIIGVATGGGLTELGHLAGSFLGGAEGAILAKPIGKIAGLARKAGQAAVAAGKEIAGETPVTGNITQGVRDVLQSIPTATGEIAKGAALDLGLAAVTSTTPEDQQALQLGTLLGAAQAARHTGAWVASGQRIAPRAWGSKTPVQSSGQLPVFDAMHQAAYRAATPAVREHINAVRQFLKGIGSDTDVFLADPTHTRTDAAGNEVNTDIEQALTKSGLGASDAELFARQNGFFVTEMPVAGRPGETRRAIVLANSDAAPHEAKHAFQDVIGEQANQAIDKVIRENYADQWEDIGRDYTEKVLGRKLGANESWRDVLLDASGDGNTAAKLKLEMQQANQFSAETGAQPKNLAALPELAKGQWRNVLAPDEAGAAADKYLSREIAAENFDAIFKNLGAALKEKTGVIPWMARIVAATTEMLGGDSLRGRTSGGPLDIPLNAGVVEAIKGQVRGKLGEGAKPEVALPPKTAGGGGPRPSPFAAPGTPEQEAKITADIAATAPEAPTGPETDAQSPREILGVFSEAKAAGQGVKITRRSAPGTPAGAIEVSRGNRRRQVQLARSIPDDQKPLWEKNFTPVKTVQLKDGSLQEQGWSPEVLAANAEKVAGFLSRTDPSKSPFAIDPNTGSFTPEGWRDLFDKVNIFAANQAAGLTGAGGEITVSPRAREFGIYEPPGNRVAAGTLTAAEADFINYLFGIPLPGEGRPTVARGGKGQFGHQLLSEATAPGRAQPLVEPRTFASKQAVELGFAGEPVKEVNPLRAEIEALPGAKPSLIEVWQNLNLKDIVKAEGAPELPAVRPNLTTLRAGFQPMPKNPKAIKEAAVRDEYGNIFTGRWHGEAIEKAIGRDINAITNEGDNPIEDFKGEQGFVTHEGEFLDRVKASERAVRLKQISKEDAQLIGSEAGYNPDERQGLEAGMFDTRRQFQPMPANPRAVRAAAVRDESGKIFEGAWHGEAFMKAQQAPGERGTLDQGFVSNTGHWYSREQAAKVAEEIGQLPRQADQELQSETLAAQRAFQPNRQDAGEDFFNRVDTNRINIMREFLALPENSDKEISWNRIPAARLKKIWLDFGKSRVLRDEKGIEKIADQVLENIARIKAVTELVGHESYGVEDQLKEEGINPTEAQWQRFWNSNFISNQFSDYAMRPLEALYENLYVAETPEEKLFLIDKVLNVIHQRGDIADLFVQGGTKTLNEIASQGGFSQGLENRGAATQSAFQPAAAEQRKEITLTGPDGKPYKALFDGYQDATMIGMGHVPQITPLEDLPGVVPANSTTYGPSLTKAGYTLPELPEAKFQPKESPEQDFNLEKGFSEDVLSGKKKLSEFPYYSDYVNTIDKEAGLLQGAKKALFIGSGPMPISPILLSERLGIPVDGLDISPEAVRLGNKVAEKENSQVQVSQGTAEDFKNYGDYDAIVLALEAGTTAEDKNKIFDAIRSQINPDTKVLARGSVSKGEFPQLPEGVKKLKTVKTFGGLSESALLDLNPESAAAVETKFQPAKRKPTDELKFGAPSRTNPFEGSKAWILPNGKVEQLGSQWHHAWLSEHPEVQKRYGLKIPPFEGNDSEGVREQALRKGFARVNLTNGRLVVEGREKDWQHLRPVVENLIEHNIDDIDKFQVSLLNDKIDRVTKSFSENLFDADTDKEKLDRVYASLSERPQAEIGGVKFQPETDEAIKGAIGHVYPRTLDVVGKTGRLANLSHTNLPREDAGTPISWRYSDKYNTVFWWEQPTTDTKQAVVDWLKSKGYSPEAHEYMHSGMTKEFYDTAHGKFQPKSDENRTVGYHNIMGQMRDEKWGDLPWFSPITHWTGEEISKMDAEISRRSKSVNQAAKFQPAPAREDFENPETLKDALSSPGWAIVTATQEAVGPWNDPANIKANEALEADLNDKGYEYLPVAGTYKGEPQGKNFLVMDISPYDAQALGKKYKQESVLTPKGLIYGDGTITPSRPEDTSIGKDATKEDFYSTLPNGTHFSIPLDFEHPYKPTGEQEQLFGGREYVSPATLTQAELRDRYPEAIVPKNSNEKIASDITGSPLYKSSDNPVKAFAEKLVNFAKQYTDNPIYQLGLKWYSDFTPLLKKHFGKDAPVMAELLAASSPNETPTQNFYYAVDALEGLKSGRFEGIIEKFNQGFQMYKDDAWLGWYNKELKAGNIPKPPASPTPEAFLAHWIYKHGLKPKQSNGQLYGFHGRAILEVLARKWLAENQGPKVANFVQNLLGTGHGATIDVWADRTMRRLGYADTKNRWRILPKNGEGVSDADFEFSQKAFAEAAKTLGVTPDALQGGLWFAEKQLWADNGWGRLDLGSYVNEIENLPLIRKSIGQRLKTTALKKKAIQMEQPGLSFEAVQPREFKK